MEAWLQASGLWRIVSGTSTLPSFPSPITEAQLQLREVWEVKSDKAAGWLYLLVDPDQRVYFNNIQDDPVKMWKSLQAVHLQKQPGMHFNPYDDLFSIRKLDQESLQSLINRVEDTICKIKDLDPLASL
ncbi:hypothetical protein P691DRAFT_796417 [Macrolepiota fuliginosa MF-IS2]|uniref:Uncharacterized protein n=1 Tax=Macrolepiota fuliginosa MF-IS2 TaxID=1400762 RepID=A0A9P5WVQ5_9AGAR|nr:hypothetical protein P691DRAFT_796417 [Macrolepiota fuliginosa MF-IS2]